LWSLVIIKLLGVQSRKDSQPKSLLTQCAVTLNYVFLGIEKEDKERIVGETFLSKWLRRLRIGRRFVAFCRKTLKLRSIANEPSREAV
jgi:hypothetical protein